MARPVTSAAALTGLDLVCLALPTGAGGPAKLPPNRRPGGAAAAAAVPAQSSASGPAPTPAGNNSSLHRSLAAPPPPPPGLKPSASTGQLPPSRSVPSSPQVTERVRGSYPAVHR